jgi:hypothetical protein
MRKLEDLSPEERAEFERRKRDPNSPWRVLSGDGSMLHMTQEEAEMWIWDGMNIWTPYIPMRVTDAFRKKD